MSRLFGAWVRAQTLKKHTFILYRSRQINFTAGKSSLSALLMGSGLFLCSSEHEWLELIPIFEKQTKIVSMPKLKSCILPRFHPPNLKAKRAYPLACGTTSIFRARARAKEKATGGIIGRLIKTHQEIKGPWARCTFFKAWKFCGQTLHGFHAAWLLCAESF